MPARHVLLINPPFASIHWPAHGIHVLQSVAKQNGHQVDVLYANLMFAGLLGEDLYEAVCDYNWTEFLGERIMAWYAFDGEVKAPDLSALPQQPALDLPRLHQILSLWLQQVMYKVRQHPCSIIGLTSTFEQTHACRILLRACRAARPDCRLIIGGANCDRGMAEGMAAYLTEVDHVFSGESEIAFCALLDQADNFTGQKIIRSGPNNAIGQLPLNDYHEFVQQFDEFLPHSRRRQQLELAYESSRGCWWGQKHHCTFCGLNRDVIGYREKSSEQVLQDLRQLKQEQQATRVLMSDFIMPHGFYKTLLPKLAQEKLGLQIFYEIKANIDLPKAMLLKQAGVDRIQPGIEALHSASLKLMNKGVRARQNIALLRYARALNIQVLWNFLYGFPGEQVAWFDEVLQFLPLLEHLQPPGNIYPISLDRFSPYFTQAANHGFSNLRPYPQFAEIFAHHPDPQTVSYHFCADSALPTLCGSTTLLALEQAVAHWRASWCSAGSKPSLCLIELNATPGAQQYLLLDSRSLHRQPRSLILDAEQAAACLLEHSQPVPATEWAVQQGLAIEFDGAVLPLVVADPALMLRFEQAQAADAGATCRAEARPTIPIFACTT